MTNSVGAEFSSKIIGTQLDRSEVNGMPSEWILGLRSGEHAWSKLSIFARILAAKIKNAELFNANRL